MDLSAEVAAIGAQLRPEHPERQIKLDVEPGVVVTADRLLIRSALENLIGNAVKFTGQCPVAGIESGTVPASTVPASTVPASTVPASTGPAGPGEICCFIRDNGAGFEPAYGHKLFQLFQRLRPVTEFAGTGVGLASVKQIVERHGGRVWAEGSPREGATFCFTLSQ